MSDEAPLKILGLMTEQGGDSESSPCPVTQSDLKGLTPSRARRAPPPSLPPTHNPLGAIGYCQ